MNVFLLIHLSIEEVVKGESQICERRAFEHSSFLIIDPRPSTNQSAILKSGSSYLWMMSVRTYVRNTSIKELTMFQASSLAGAWTVDLCTTEVLYRFLTV